MEIKSFNSTHGVETTEKDRSTFIEKKNKNKISLSQCSLIKAPLRCDYVKKQTRHLTGSWHRIGIKIFHTIWNAFSKCVLKYQAYRDEKLRRNL